MANEATVAELKVMYRLSVVSKVIGSLSSIVEGTGSLAFKFGRDYGEYLDGRSDQQQAYTA